MSRQMYVWHVTVAKCIFWVMYYIFQQRFSFRLLNSHAQVIAEQQSLVISCHINNWTTEWLSCTITCYCNKKHACKHFKSNNMIDSKFRYLCVYILNQVGKNAQHMHGIIDKALCIKFANYPIFLEFMAFVHAKCHVIMM